MYEEGNTNSNQATSCCENTISKPRWFNFGLQIIKRLVIIGLYTFDITFDMLNGVDFLTGENHEHDHDHEIVTDHSRYCIHWRDFKHPIWGSLTIGNLAIYLPIIN